MLTDLSLDEMLMRVAAYLVVCGVHGWTLAWVALRLGDVGPRSEGKLTPSPFEHMSLSALIAAVAAATGWIRAVDLDPRAFRLGVMAVVVCLAASLTAIVVLGVAASAIRPLALAALGPPLDRYAVQLLSVMAEVSLLFVLLNLIPLPPLAAGHLLSAIAPSVAAKLWLQEVYIGIALAVAFVVTRGTAFRPALGLLRDALSPLGLGPS